MDQPKVVLVFPVVVECQMAVLATEPQFFHGAKNMQEL
jgi:hypothetical protein